MNRPCKIDLIVGTRPNIIKLGPLASSLSSLNWCHPRVVFLEQHSAPELGHRILSDLGVDATQLLRIALPRAHYGQRMGDMIGSYDTELQRAPADLVVVFGDVDATLAAALTAKRLGIPVAHVEAGLRSHDRRMPEELNRLMVDAIADLFFTTSEDAVDTLVRIEGKAASTVHFVGNLMIDSLVSTADRSSGESLCEAMDVTPRGFAVATFHRPSNVDEADALEEVVSLLEGAASELPVILPLHPRTSASLARHHLRARLDAIPGLYVTAPIGYRDFISLVSQARVVLTDSGGLQEETSYFGIPCITVRENTERPVTVSLGTNRLASRRNAAAILTQILADRDHAVPSIPLWDGRTANRIAGVLGAWWARQSQLADPPA